MLVACWLHAGCMSGSNLIPIESRHWAPNGLQVWATLRTRKRTGLQQYLAFPRFPRPHCSAAKGLTWEISACHDKFAARQHPR